MSLEILGKSPLRPETLTTPDQQYVKHLGLQALGTQLSLYPRSEYPAHDKRYFATELPANLDIPAGTWDTTALPTPEEYAENLRSGLLLDSYGRPINPWLSAMVADPKIGAVAGKGVLYDWGANRAGDGINVLEYQGVDWVLLGVRSDCGEKAFVGGFEEEKDKPAVPPPGLTIAEAAGINAAGREGSEEATFVPPSIVTPQIVYRGPVADVRNTAHAWIETTAVLFDFGHQDTLPEIKADDDADHVMWTPLEEARRLPLYGSHNQLIELMVAKRRLPA